MRQFVISLVISLNRRTDNSDFEQYISDLIVNKDIVAQRNIVEDDRKDIQIGYGEGMMLHILVKLSNASKVLEIGTFQAFSSICIASALPDSGSLITIEKNIDNYQRSIENINNFGLSKKIKIVNGSAQDILLSINDRFDMIFIDADKINYQIYLLHAKRLIRDRGLIIVDNTLSFGNFDVVNHKDDERIKCIHELNKDLFSDANFITTIVPTMSGMTIAMKI